MQGFLVEGGTTMIDSDRCLHYLFLNSAIMFVAMFSSPSSSQMMGGHHWLNLHIRLSVGR